MNIKIVLYILCALLLVHGICYFFNIDLIAFFEKNEDNEYINENIIELEQSLEQLKEFS
jgi:hypothetical protein